MKNKGALVMVGLPTGSVGLTSDVVKLNGA
jgi:hypothetical protein